MERIRRLISWVQGTRAVRVFQHYSNLNGGLLATGLAYQALFAIFAAVWVGFSILGLVVTGDADLQHRIISSLATAVPGLIDTGSGGAIKPDALLQPGVFSWTGAIALVGLLVTALGFLASLRTAIRVVFGLPQVQGNPVVLKLKDLGVGVCFAVALVVSAAMSFLGTSATGWLLGTMGIGDDSVVGSIVARVLSIAVMFVLDAVTLGLLFRVLSGVAIPWVRLRDGVLVGAVALGALKILFGAAVLGGTGSNPLLKSFAVILGLLIFFDFVCQAILIAASWITVGLADRGHDVDPVASRHRILEAQELLLRHGLVSGRPIARRGRRIRIDPS